MEKRNKEKAPKSPLEKSLGMGKNIKKAQKNKPQRKNSRLQGDKKKHANWLFLGEIIQPNLPKFAFNLIRGRRVRI